LGIIGPNRLKPFGPSRKEKTGRFQSGARVEKGLSAGIYGFKRAGPVGRFRPIETRTDTMFFLIIFISLNILVGPNKLYFSLFKANVLHFRSFQTLANQEHSGGYFTQLYPSLFICSIP
jgi:hypothetical protein